MQWKSFINLRNTDKVRNNNNAQRKRNKINNFPWDTINQWYSYITIKYIHMNRKNNCYTIRLLCGVVWWMEQNIRNLLCSVWVVCIGTLAKQSSLLRQARMHSGMVFRMGKMDVATGHRWIFSTLADIVCEREKFYDVCAPG